MVVRDLMAALDKLPQDAEVFTFDAKGKKDVAVKDVLFDEDENKVTLT